MKEELELANKEALLLIQLNAETQRSVIGIERDKINLFLSKLAVAGFFLGGLGFLLNYFKPFILHYFQIGGN